MNASKLEAEIDRALVEDPTDVEAFAVYADYLQQQGDPRGELIACHLKGTAPAKRRAAQLMKEHARDLLGIFADWDEEIPLQAEWRSGFIRSARLFVNRDMEDEGFDQATLTKALLSLPSSRFLEELTLGCGSIHESRIPERVNEALIERGPIKTMRKLSFVTEHEEEMLSWTSAGDLGHLSKTAPNLTSLFVDAGSLELGEPKMKSLEELVIETCGFSVDNAESIAAARWPALRKMVLWFGSRNYGVEIPFALVEKMLDKKRFPALVHLGLCNNELTDELVDLISEHPLLPQLEVLDLSKGTMTDAGAQRMIDQAKRFKHLKKIDLSANFIGEVAGPLERALGQVELGEYSDGQRDAEEWEGEVHRYADVGE